MPWSNKTFWAKIPTLRGGGNSQRCSSNLLPWRTNTATEKSSTSSLQQNKTTVFTLLLFTLAKNMEREKDEVTCSFSMIANNSVTCREMTREWQKSDSDSERATKSKYYWCTIWIVQLLLSVWKWFIIEIYKSGEHIISIVSFSTPLGHLKQEISHLLTGRCRSEWLSLTGRGIQNIQYAVTHRFCTAVTEKSVVEKSSCDNGVQTPEHSNKPKL